METTVQVLPRWFVPVVLTETSVAERVILSASRGRCGAALLFCTTPFMGVEGDTSCLVGVCTCRRREGVVMHMYVDISSSSRVSQKLTLAAIAGVHP